MLTRAMRCGQSAFIISITLRYCLTHTYPPAHLVVLARSPSEVSVSTGHPLERKRKDHGDTAVHGAPDRGMRKPGPLCHRFQTAPLNRMLLALVAVRVPTSSVGPRQHCGV